MRFLKRINWSTVAGVVVLILKSVSEANNPRGLTPENLAGYAIGGGLISARDKSETAEQEQPSRHPMRS